MELYNYQKEAIAKATASLTSHKYFAMFCDMGTGKTVMALATIASIPDIASVLIVAPKSIIHQWRDIVDKWNETLKLKDAALSIEYSTYESLHKVSRTYYSYIILDESVRIKNDKTLIWKRLTAIDTKYKLILNGCPVADSPMDIFNQFKWLDSTLFGVSSKVFELRYAYNLDLLRERIKDVSAVISINDVINALPDKFVHTLREPVYTPAIISKSTAIEDIPAIMTNKDVLLTKIILLDKIIKDLDDKHAIIFTTYRKEAELVAAYCYDEKLSYEIITGDSSDAGREDAVQKFQSRNAQILILQIKCGQFGLNLESAHNAIYFSLMYSYTAFTQSQARIYRLGQHNDCHYYILLTTIVDDTIWNCLQHKQSFTAKYFEALKEKYIEGDK